MLSPVKLLLVGEACSQSLCLPPAHCRGSSQTGACGYLPLSSHFGEVLATVMADCTLPDLWHHFGWGPAKGILDRHILRKGRGGVCGASKVLAGSL